ATTHPANFEADTGHATSAVGRLLAEATRHGNDPELFAGVVHSCRYCGLLEQSVAAHREARGLDPNVPTSLEQTLLMTCDLDRLLAAERPPGLGSGDRVIRAIGLGLAGRRDDARRRLLELRAGTRIAAFRTWSDFLLAWLDRRPADMLAIRLTLGALKVMD